MVRASAAASSSVIEGLMGATELDASNVDGETCGKLMLESGCVALESIYNIFPVGKRVENILSRTCYLSAEMNRMD